MLNRFFTEYFGFNKQQRNGLLVLVCISFSLLLIRIIYPHFIKPENIEVNYLPLFERQIDSLESVNQSVKPITSNFEKTSLFVFDPNQVTYEQLVQLGFRTKTAKGFIKFRKKGFVFKQKADVKKVFGVSEQFYNNLEPYILIETATKNISKKTPVTTKPQQKLDLNTADSASLVALRGIGPSYAKRILKYRSILGGYVSVEQLKEVYGFTDEIYSNIQGLFMVGNNGVTKINVNKDDFKVINKHPYITYEQTKLICNQRRQSPLTEQKLKEIIGDESLFSRLSLYLEY